MFFRDYYCSACGLVREDIEAPDASHVALELACDKCRMVTAHHAVCNGGMKARYRFNDFPTDPRFYRGQVEVTGHSATASGRKIETLDGKGAVQDRPQFTDPDRRGDRQERHYWKSDKKRGRTPLYFDGHAAGQSAASKGQ